MAAVTGKVTFMGNPLTLIGNEAKVGDRFPAGIVLSGNDLKPFNLSDAAGVKVVTTVPSLDTPVCDTQVRKFNEKAAGLAAKVFAVSADLPFAQARWCGAAGIKNVMTLSDHAQMALADALGVHVKELRLLARTVFVVDSAGKIVYREIVPEITSEPNYEAALAAVASAA
jgi:thiol peroxidase